MAQGMACIRSLQRWDADAHIAVLALDQRAHNLIPRSPGVFVELRPTAGAESIWRLTPGLILRAMGILRAKAIAYVDADMFAFAPLDAVWRECLQCDVAIVPHRWTPRHRDRLRDNGRYNVGWLTVTNNHGGTSTMSRWERYCHDWKPTKHEPRFMDQRFFDFGPNLGEVWHDVQHLGVNLAPYNQEQYEYVHGPRGLSISDGLRCDPLVLYHFHEWRCQRTEFAINVTRTGYHLHPDVERYVYPAYEKEACRYALQS